jgi:hypothetical protein
VQTRLAQDTQPVCEIDSLYSTSISIRRGAITTFGISRLTFKLPGREATDTVNRLCYNANLGQTCCSSSWACPSGAFCLVNGSCCPSVSFYSSSLGRSISLTIHSQNRVKIQRSAQHKIASPFQPTSPHQPLLVRQRET